MKNIYKITALSFYLIFNNYSYTSNLSDEEIEKTKTNSQSIITNYLELKRCCSSIKAIEQDKISMGIESFSSLKTLTVTGSTDDSLPTEIAQKLPTSLTTLNIIAMGKLREDLIPAITRLSSLEKLVTDATKNQKTAIESGLNKKRSELSIAKK